MQKFKVLEEWYEKDTRTGQFIHCVEVNPIEGGKSEIIRLTVDSDVPFNSLKNGYHTEQEAK